MLKSDETTAVTIGLLDVKSHLAHDNAVRNADQCLANLSIISLGNIITDGKRSKNGVSEAGRGMRWTRGRCTRRDSWLGGRSDGWLLRRSKRWLCIHERK